MLDAICSKSDYNVSPWGQWIYDKSHDYHMSSVVPQVAGGSRGGHREMVAQMVCIKQLIKEELYLASPLCLIRRKQDGKGDLDSWLCFTHLDGMTVPLVYA